MDKSYITLLGNFNPVSEIQEHIQEEHCYDRNNFLILLCSNDDPILLNEELLRILNQSKV